MNWRTIALPVLVVVGMFGCRQVASAADLPAQAPAYKAALASNGWTGFYFGANFGGVWGASNSQTTTVGTAGGSYIVPNDVPTFDAAGAQHPKASGFFTGGAQLGYNWQLGAIALVGLEADFQSFSTRGSASSTAVYPSFAPAAFTISSSVGTDWLATVRGRAGVIAGRDWLVYGTGGLAISQVRASWSFTDTCAFYTACNGFFVPGLSAAEAASASATKVGWTAGAGFETRLASNWSVKAEYLYVNLGSISATGLISNAAFYGATGNVISHSMSVSDHIGRVGLNYHL
jgi:outer membrane immunogenic protein